jgi:hypothetical protein
MAQMAATTTSNRNGALQWNEVLLKISRKIIAESCAVTDPAASLYALLLLQIPRRGMIAAAAWMKNINMTSMLLLNSCFVVDRQDAAGVIMGQHRTLTMHIIYARTKTGWFRSG